MIFQIDASGEPFKMRLDHSTGNADLDQSAILAVRKAAPYLAPPTVPEHLQATFNIYCHSLLNAAMNEGQETGSFKCKNILLRASAWSGG